MQIGKCRVKLHTYQDLPKVNVTPAEVVILQRAHLKNANGEVVSEVVLTGEVERLPRDEKRRLLQIYGPKLVETAFPGDMPRMPERFMDIGIAPSSYVEPQPEQDKAMEPMPSDNPPVEEPPPQPPSRKRKFTPTPMPAE